MQHNKIKQSKIWLFAGCGLFTASFLLLYVARSVEGFAQWYAVTVYPVLVSVIGRICGQLPVSLVEILLYIVILLVIIRSTVLIKGITKKEKSVSDVGRFFTRIFLFSGILFLVYTLNCGINYQRDSFAECIELEVEEYTVEELKKVCEILTEDINELADVVARDENGLMIIGEESNKFLFGGELAVEAMEKTSAIYDELSGYYPKPKGLLCPWILSVQKLSGIYSPFTIEANYNCAMVDYNIPFTMCHELSHLRGFMQEQEANFIAYLACMTSESAEFRYSGSMLGWIHCMNTLYDVDMEAWKELRMMLDESVFVDLQANSEFWAKYDGNTAEVADMLNDSYLKANGQADGVKSYDKMVDLLVAYYK